MCVDMHLQYVRIHLPQYVRHMRQYMPVYMQKYVPQYMRDMSVYMPVYMLLHVQAFHMLLRYLQ